MSSNLRAIAHPPPAAGRAQSLDELLQSARDHLIANPRQSLSAADQAVAMADAGEELATRAAARHVRGDAHRLLGDHEAALRDYADASDMYRRLRRSIEAARTDSSAADSLRCLGRPTQALRLANRARRVFTRSGEALRSAVLEEIIGLIHFQQGDYERARRYFDRARPMIAAYGRPMDLAALNNNAATTLTNLDRLREAEALYTAARVTYAEQGTDAALARVDMNLGFLALRQGRYGAAIDMLRRAGDVFENLRNIPLAVLTRLDLADAYLALNLLDEAGALSREQLRLAGEYRLENEHARALLYVSTHQGRLGRLDEALNLLVKAEGEFASQDNLVWRTRCVLGRAALLLARDGPTDARQAAALARRAARTFGRVALPSRQALAQTMLARAYLRVGRLRQAEEEARAALWHAQGIGVPWLVFESQYMLGRVLRARSDRTGAYVAYRGAAEALERVRSELEPEELRMSLVTDKTDVYQELVVLCLEASDTDEALQYAEHAKSRAFAERLAGTGGYVEPSLDAQVLGTADARLLERMRDLRDELAWFYSRLGDGATTAATQRLRRQVATREAELLRLHRRLQPASRRHAAVLGVGSGPGTVPALRRKLRAGTVVLEYFQAGSELVLFVFDSRRLTAHRLGPMDRVVELVERFRFQISKFALGQEYARAHAASMQAAVDEILSELYALLIDPCADELVDAAQLVIVPHGILHYVPFHAFVDPSGTPLVESVDVAYAPSASVLASCLDRRPVPMDGSQHLLIGVPEAAIPQVSGEIQALERLFGPSRVLAGAAATEQAFRQHAPEADVIHMASHAVFRQDNPLFSAIRLADGWLSVYDLYGLRLRASLVTLSACETGVNDILGGDELIGLARGFFQAGAASVVVSLWAVNDASTALLMQRLYAYLQTGLGPAAALRLAQRDLRREYPHPYNWAPFLVIGRP